MSMFAGIDWGGKHHQLAVVDDVGREVFNLGFAHGTAGITDLLAVVLGFELFGIAIERPEGSLVERLQAAGHQILGVSPRG